MMSRPSPLMLSSTVIVTGGFEYYWKEKTLKDQAG
jgi:hypothetical protein